MSLPRLPFLLICALFASGCQQTAPIQDTEPSVPPEPVWQSAAAGWLPMHRNPRVGDFAEHQRLDARGLTPVRRRSEVLKVDDRQVEIRQTYTTDGSPAMHFLLDRQGRVNAAWVIPSDQSGRRERQVLPAVRRHRKPITDKSMLPLASGNYPLSEIVSRRITLEDGSSSRRVDYLSNNIPFRTLVSLSGRQAISHRDAVKLIGRIAVPKAPKKPSRSAMPITDGWVLMAWGRGKAPRR